MLALSLRLSRDVYKRQHVYAVDCYGHGGSSKNPAKYSALENSQDFIWFIHNIIKAPVFISGHSSGGKMCIRDRVQAQSFPRLG